MSTYRTTFEAEIDVRFLEPEKSEAYYCADGEWRSCFYRIDDLEDLAQSLSSHLQGESARWHAESNSFRIFMEGYGCFEKQDDGWYMNTSESWEGGKIMIREEIELEPTFTELRNEETADAE